MVKISVIVCTHNRAKILDRVLNEFTSQTLDFSLYEVLIVDNASTDNTREISLKYLEKFTNFKYVYEPELGLSTARNRGIKEAKGEIVAFIDDDAIPTKCWIEEHFKIYEKFPDVVAVAGKILLKLPDTIPFNKYEPFKSYFGFFDYSDKICELKWPESPRGGNFSVKKTIGDEVKWFCENLFLYNDERFFFYKIMVEKNYKVIYNPDAIVYHIVPEERLNMRFIIKRYFYQGVSDRIMEREILRKKNSKDQISKLLYNLAKVYKKILILIYPFTPVQKRIVVLSEIFRRIGYTKEIICEIFSRKRKYQNE